MLHWLLYSASGSVKGITPGPTDPLPLGDYLLYEDFEDGTGFEGQHKQGFAGYSFQVVTDIKKQGSYAGRFELRSSDGMASGGTRTEILCNGVTIGQEMWYSLALYFPDGGWQTDSASDTILQWWQTSDYTQASTLRTRNNQLYLQVGFDPGDLKTYTLVPSIQPGKWYELVFHFIHSHTDGLIERWVDGVKQANIVGGNMYQMDLPQFKVGIYKAAWNNGATTDSTLRVLYVDNVKIGGADMTYERMKP